jgi:hypothetical protein
MSRGRRLVVALPIFVVGLVAVVTGATLREPIAAAIRRLFGAATPVRFLVLMGVAIAAVAATALVERLSRARPRGARALRPIARASRSIAVLIDRVEWPVSVGVVSAVAGVAWYSLGRALAVPHVFADELIHTEAARNLALHGSLATHGYGFVTPAIDSLSYLVTPDDVAAHRLLQATNVAVMVTTAFLAYPLAHRAMSSGWALVVAVLTPAVPWMTYARFVLTEPDFYPVFLLFALLLVRALERPTLKRQMLLLAALVLTYLTRTQAVVLAGAVVCAVPLYGIAQGHARETLKAFAPTWAVYLLGAAALALALGAGIWSPLGPYGPLLNGWSHPHGLAIWAAANTSALFLGLGGLVGVAAPLGAASLLRRTASSGAAALAAVSVSTTVWLLASVSLLSESAYGQGSVHERDLFFAAPLVISCAIAWATNGCARPKLLTAVTAAAAVGCAATIPSGAITPHSVDALSFKLWSQMDSGPLSPSSWIIAATAAGVLAVLTMRSAWPLVLTIALAAAGVAAASDYRSVETQTVADRYAWVDSAVPANAQVTLLYIGYARTGCPANAAPSPLPTMSLYTEYFNSQVDRVGHLLDDNAARGLGSEKFGLRPDGVVTSDGRPLRPEFAVTDARIEVAGVREAALPAQAVTPEPGLGTGGLALWRLQGAFRLLRPAQVRRPSAEIVCG